ncbi:hypothetical protein DAY19_08445 [Halobacteriovorax vibrionivorans]|uniref:Uncharacterized protein n=1 Tax=Halobacteriovorax vibrionivorans TaxID=2152716 RepID=A0ABY0IHV5_9BACT|nr:MULTISPECIES: hypothetical protein [Halobacteriovorax]RZF21708.1 hypothetical protein DAY19_08445 [Halobacteriovorax vibrionivorans]TGD46169.1 hypothetical protein EP118_13145 [Halobacteriovorax sp. Y22]
MWTKFQFELALEKTAEDFYLNGASNFAKLRSGNSSENEQYFKNVAKSIREQLGCQQILLKSGECPDSGIFGEFDYKHEEEVNWELVKTNQLVALQVEGANKQVRYIELDAGILKNVSLPIYSKYSKKIKDKHNSIKIFLNELINQNDFYGVEYKASESKYETSINVASFNSTCPSKTKTNSLKLKLIHNFKASGRFKVNGFKLKSCTVEVMINFNVYYLIVNDYPNGRLSEIKQVFVCDGGFFAPNMSEDEASKLSKEIKPDELGKEYNLYRVKLRYRPFFDSRTIKANGFGLYTSWDPKIPGAIEEEKQREEVLKEVKRVQQNFSDVVGEEQETEVIEGTEDNPDNVIYLSLRQDRINKRAA